MISEREYMNRLNDLYTRRDLHAKYAGALDTPESGTAAFWTVFWKDFFDGYEPATKVPQCRWAAKAIREPMLDVNGMSVPAMLVLVPREFRGGSPGLLRLGELIPSLRYSASFLEDTHFSFGYIKTEATLDTPNLNTTQGILLDHARNRGYLPQRAVTNLLQGRALYILTGEYPDYHTRSRLLGSREGNYYLNSHHSPNTGEETYINWDYEPDFRNEYFGGRFEQLRKG